MPQLGESIAEATVTRLISAEGEQVSADQEVMEVETNKATMSVTSPCQGLIVRWTVEVGRSYAVGASLGELEVVEEEARRRGLVSPGSLPGEKPAGAIQASAHS